MTKIVKISTKINRLKDLSISNEAVLGYLLENQGRVLTRDTLLNSVWGYNCFVTSRSVDRCITTLRNKIETDPHAPQHILTIRDFGYKFRANNDSC